MIEPTCAGCGHELEEPGGLLFGPPMARTPLVTGLAGMVTKDHLCVECHHRVKKFLAELKVLLS